MCGIFFSCSASYLADPRGTLRSCLEKRGPDHCNIIRTEGRRPVIPRFPIRATKQPTYHLSFLSTVLSLRGAHVVKQPLVDPASTSVLCWNGEAWKIDGKAIVGNDATAVFDLLLKISTQNESDASTLDRQGESNFDKVMKVFSRITGPYAFVYYDARNAQVFYGRDVLGRRSLLINKRRYDSIAISSICDPEHPQEWEEVEANGVYMIHLSAEWDMFQDSAEKRQLDENFRLTVSGSSATEIYSKSLFMVPWIPQFPPVNKSVPTTPPVNLTIFSTAVSNLASHLYASLRIRAEVVPEPPSDQANPPRIAILFSGGLDCTLLARLVHEVIPGEQEIDLLNVAFENPRVIKAAAKHDQNAPNLRSPYAICPDRRTGLSSYGELTETCPERKWRFVRIDVPYAKTIEHRPQIISLIRPHNSEMDLSIACALYFAACGNGTAENNHGQSAQSYITPARVLLSGLGADEIFGGYQRHATAFDRKGYPGLLDELELDFNRLGSRNLGRDDRVVSHWGKEVRYPYLDEDLVGWALSLPVWEKCGFGERKHSTLEPANCVEPGKKLLRLLALKQGLNGAAFEKKRAIQFGARTAKMELGTVKGTQALS